MGVSQTAGSARKISGGSWKYRKGVYYRKGGSARKTGLQSGAELLGLKNLGCLSVDFVVVGNFMKVEPNEIA